MTRKLNVRFVPKADLAPTRSPRRRARLAFGDVDAERLRSLEVDDDLKASLTASPADRLAFDPSMILVTIRVKRQTHNI
jgi:hypothetical protein